MTLAAARRRGRPVVRRRRSIYAWNPADHPRDRRGRFTKSRTKDLTDAERERGRAVVGSFKPKSFSSDQEALTYLEKSRPALTADQANAVSYYTGDAFLEINQGLRSTGDTNNPETVAALRSAMSPTEDDLILTRTVGMEAFGSVPVEELAGRKVVDAAFSSTALGVAYGSKLGKVTMKIAVPKGTPAVFVAPYTRNPMEREIVLADGMEFAVASVTPNDDFGYDMTLVVLPPPGGWPQERERAQKGARQ